MIITIPKVVFLLQGRQDVSFSAEGIPSARGIQPKGRYALLREKIICNLYL